jgi:hypothetical protein
MEVKSTDDDYESDPYQRTFKQVICDDCGAHGPYFWAGKPADAKSVGDPEQAAIDAWNNRLA